MASPLSVILEARGKKKNEITPTDGEDYTKEEIEKEPDESNEEPETDTEDNSEETNPTDYTAEEPEEETDDEPDTTTDESDEELTPTDYTSEDPDADADTDEGDETSDEETNPNDYTAEDPEDGSGTDDETTDEVADGDSDNTAGSEGGAISPEDEKRKKKELFYDFVELYELIKTFIGKLSSQANNTIFVNKIVIQINKNLNDSRKAIWNFIIYEFDKNNYVTNLTKYNFFVENIRINIEMVHKVKDYLSKSETFK